MIDEIRAHLGLHDRVGSGRTEGFAEGPDQDIDVIRNAELGGEAGPVRTADADRMGLVHDEDAVVFLLEPDELFQVRRIAVHAEDRFGHEEHPAVCGAPVGQDLLKLFAVEVAVAAELRIRKTHPVDDARVVQLVRKNQVPVGRQSGQDARYSRGSRC